MHFWDERAIASNESEQARHCEPHKRERGGVAEIHVCELANRPRDRQRLVLVHFIACRAELIQISVSSAKEIIEALNHITKAD